MFEVKSVRVFKEIQASAKHLVVSSTILDSLFIDKLGICGPYRGTIKKMFSPSIINETSRENSIEKFGINKIYGILLIYIFWELVGEINPCFGRDSGCWVYLSPCYIATDSPPRLPLIQSSSAQLPF